MSGASAEQQLVDLRLHVRHLLTAIDRGYFGEVVGLRDSAFVMPLRTDAFLAQQERG